MVFKNQNLCFLVKILVFVQSVNYSQLPAYNLKLLHESLVNMQIKTSQAWRQIGTHILMTQNGQKMTKNAFLSTF